MKRKRGPSLFDVEIKSRGDVRDMVEGICADWGVPVPLIRFTKRKDGETDGRYYSGRVSLEFLGMPLRAITIVHELNHYIVDMSDKFHSLEDDMLEAAARDYLRSELGKFRGRSKR